MPVQLRITRADFNAGITSSALSIARVETSVKGRERSSPRSAQPWPPPSTTLPRATCRTYTSPPQTPIERVTNNGSGSVTSMLGAVVSMGTGSPKAAAISPPQAPAVLTRKRADTSRPLALRIRNRSASRIVSTTGVNSLRSAPAARAARPKAGATRRGLACPSSGASDAPITRALSHGYSSRTRSRPISCRWRSKSAAAAA